MKNILKITVIAAALVVMFMPDTAYGQFGVARRTARRTTVVVASTASSAASASAASAQKQSAAAQQQVAAANQQTAAAQQQAAAATQQAAIATQQAADAEKAAAAAKQEAAIAQGLLPIGTIAMKLPAGCTPIVVANVSYSQCGLNVYRAVFQGNNLVYMTVALPK